MHLQQKRNQLIIAKAEGAVSLIFGDWVYIPKLDTFRLCFFFHQKTHSSYGYSDIMFC